MLSFWKILMKVGVSGLLEFSLDHKAEIQAMVEDLNIIAMRWKCCLFSYQFVQTFATVTNTRAMENFWMGLGNLSEIMLWFFYPYTIGLTILLPGFVKTYFPLTPADGDSISGSKLGRTEKEEMRL